jgi:hypothetical protein
MDCLKKNSTNGIVSFQKTTSLNIKITPGSCEEKAFLTEENLALLKTGVETQVDDFAHYHFIGAPFSGLWKKKQTFNQKQKQLKKKKMRNLFHPAIHVKVNDDGWECILDKEYALKEDEVVFESLVQDIKREKIQLPVYEQTRMQGSDPYDPNPAILVLEEEMNVDMENHRARQQEASQHNKNMHSGNGNIDPICEFNQFLQGKSILEYTETVKVTQYNEKPGWEVFLRVKAGGVTYISVGKALTKKEAKREACTLIMNQVRPFIPSLLIIGGVEQNPGPQNEAINTKRDSKRHQPKERTRIERLSNTHPEIAERHLRIEKEKLQRKINKKQEMQLMKKLDTPSVHGFGIPVNTTITFPQFNDIFTKLVNTIPPELVNNIQWVDVGMALWELFHQSSFASKWMACRVLYREFGLESMTVGVFGGLVFKLLSKIGYLDGPSTQSAKDELRIHYIEASPIAIVVTLILSILFKNKPSDGVMKNALNACKEIPSTSTGIEMVMSAAQKTIDFVTGSFSDENTIEYKVNKITNKVKELLTPQGLQSIALEKGSFENIALMKIESMELMKFIRPHTALAVHFNTVCYNLNTLYNKAQLLANSGHGYRKRPVVFHLWGSAGIGKSRLINYIAADTIPTILQLENESYTKKENEKEFREKVENYEQFVYFRPVGLKYQQNFDTNFSKIYVCDDANQVHPDFQAGESTYPMELIHLNNSHDHMLNVAEVENKKNALFKSSLIIATDNMKTPDLYYLGSSDAYSRRIDFRYEVKVKKEFGKEQLIDGSKKIFVVDSTKIDASKENTHIYEFIGNDNIKYTYEQVIKKLNEKLIEVDACHSSDTKLFRERAIRSFETTVKVVPENNTTLINSLTRAFNDVELRTHVGIEVIPQDTRFFPSFDYVRPGKYKQKWNAFKTFIFACLLRYVTIHTLHKWGDKLNFWKQKVKDNRRTILLTAGIFSILLGGYYLYKVTRPKRTLKRSAKTQAEKSKKEKRDDSESDTDEEEANGEGKYDAGDARKSAPKNKKPGKGAIKSVPLHSNSDAIVQRIDDVDAYLRTPEVHVSCPRAFMMIKILCSNCYYIFFESIKDGKKTVAGLRGFFLKQGIFITNRHLLPDNEAEFKTGKFHLYNLFQTYNDIPVSKVKINTFAHESEEGDLFYDLIWIDFGNKNVKSHIDISTFSKDESNFVRECDLSTLEGTKIEVFTLSVAAEFAENEHREAITTGNAKWYAEVQHTRITQMSQEAMTCKGRDGEDLYTWKTMEYPMQSAPGYCGSVVVINDQSAHPGKILGIHMAGYMCMDKSFGQIITEEMIKTINLGVHVSLKRKSGDYNTVMRADQFTFLRTVPHTLRSPTKTKLRPSIFHNLIVPTQKAPARMGFAPDGEHVMAKAMKKYLTPHCTLDEQQECIASSIFRVNFKPHRKIRELTREEAIKGIEGNEFIRGINRKSSPGYPLNVETKKPGKQEYLGKDDEWIINHPRVCELITEFKDAVSQNERPQMAFISTIKDELLKLSKVEIWKSRCFAAAPLQYTIIFREKYLDFLSTVMENRIRNMSLVGVNMYSDDVDYIVKEMTKVATPNSKQFLAGDFTNFDGTLNLNLLWEIYRFIESMYKRDDPICKALWTELVDSQQLFGNTVIHVPRGQPSGNPATTLINTFYNIGLMYLTLHEVMEEIGTIDAYEIQEELLDNYRGEFYGDDNILSFSKKLVNIMDPNLITKVMAKYGHKYTTDAKDTSFFEYKTLYEISILKRHFSFDNKLQAWIAPLELISILEPINWDKVQDGHYDLKKIQMQVNVRTAIRELSLHDSETFNLYRTKLINLSEHYDLDLTPDCYYDQQSLRKMIRRSDNIFCFSNDFYNEYTLVENEFETTVTEEEGMAIESGEYLSGSPTQISHKQKVVEFNPTLHFKQWVAILPYSQSQIVQPTANTTVTFTGVPTGNFIADITFGVMMANDVVPGYIVTVSSTQLGYKNTKVCGFKHYSAYTANMGLSPFGIVNNDTTIIFDVAIVSPVSIPFAPGDRLAINLTLSNPPPAGSVTISPLPLPVYVDNPTIIQNPLPVVVDNPVVIQNPLPVVVDNPTVIQNPLPVIVDNPTVIQNPLPVMVENPTIIQNPLPVLVNNPTVIQNPLPVQVNNPTVISNPLPVVVNNPTPIPNPLPVQVTNTVIVDGAVDISNTPLPVTSGGSGSVVTIGDQPVYVRMYEENVPTMHMMQYTGNDGEELKNEQILTLNTDTPLVPETIPRQVEIDMQKLQGMLETRDHSIKDILCRMYAIADLIIPPGGNSNDQIVSIDPLSEFLTQVNVSQKLDGFAFFRSNFYVTILTRTLPTTSGSLIASFYPQINTANRTLNILQKSQTPNKRILLSSSEGIRMKIPFIAPFLGKNLITSSGSLGNLILSLLSEPTINNTKVKVYIQADCEDILVEYPTFATGDFALLSIQERIKQLQIEQTEMLNRVEIEQIPHHLLIEQVANRLPREIAEREFPDLIPSVHMMKLFGPPRPTKSTPNTPVTSVKWKPGMNQLNKEGVDTSYKLSLSNNNSISATKGEFGSSEDEMSVNFIQKSQQIIGIPRVNTSQIANTVIFAKPCSVIDFAKVGDDIFLTHQSWLAMKCQKWMAKLKFDIMFTGNQFHAVSLRAIFNPNDAGMYDVGDVISFNNLNKAKSKEMDFDGQKVYGDFIVEPALSTMIKNVPTPRAQDGSVNTTNWQNNIYSEECSYGMFYLTIEVPLVATSSVAPFVDFVVDISMEDLLLSDPVEYDSLVPRAHVKTGLLSSIAEKFIFPSRQDRFEGERGQSENAMVPNRRRIIDECLGDEFTHMKELMSVFTPFSPIVSIPNGSALLLEPFKFRTLDDLASTQKFKFHDTIDYFASGFAYYQGQMEVRIGKTTEQNGPFGEVTLTTKRNPAITIPSLDGTGVQTISAPSSARSGSRVQPLYKEECIPQIQIPFYQPFHMSRITSNNSFDAGNQPKIMLLRPYNSEYFRLFRASGNDFQFGFLTALPPFRLVEGQLYT